MFLGTGNSFQDICYPKLRYFTFTLLPMMHLAMTNSTRDIPNHALSNFSVFKYLHCIVFFVIFSNIKRARLNLMSF